MEGGEKKKCAEVRNTAPLQPHQFPVSLIISLCVCISTVSSLKVRGFTYVGVAYFQSRVSMESISGNQLKRGASAGCVEWNLIFNRTQESRFGTKEQKKKKRLFGDYLILPEIFGGVWWYLNTKNAGKVLQNFRQNQIELCWISVALFLV